MNDQFEVWAVREIKRLREEADVLQLAYDRFTSAQGRKPKPANPTPSDGQGRRSKYEALYAKWAEASRDGPIGYAVMERIAQDAGYEMNGNLLRSTVHAAKKAGRARAEADGYIWKPAEAIPTETGAASPVQEDAA